MENTNTALSLRLLSVALSLVISSTLLTVPDASATETQMSMGERSLRAVGGAVSMAAWIRRLPNLQSDEWNRRRTRRTDFLRG